MQLNPQAKIPPEDVKKILKLNTSFTPAKLIQKWKEGGVDVLELNSKYGSKTGNVLKAVEIAGKEGILADIWKHPNSEDFVKTKLKDIAETKLKEKALQAQKEKAQKRQEIKTTLREKIKERNIQESRKASEKLERRGKFIKTLGQGPSTLPKSPSPLRPTKIDLVV